MRYLIDTHSLIWFIDGDDNLSFHARKIIENEDNYIFVSIASLWEIAIKFNIGTDLPTKVIALQGDVITR